MNTTVDSPVINAIDRAIIVATQGGLPLLARPYHEIATRLDISADEVMAGCKRCRNAV